MPIIRAPHAVLPAPAAALAVVAGVAPLPAHAGVVYERWGTPSAVVFCHDFNTVPPETSSSMEVLGGPESSSQIAQRITLAGTPEDRFLTRIDFRLWALAPTSGAGEGDCITDVVLTLYGVGAANLPASVIWQGTVESVPLVHTSDASAGTVTVSFFPHVEVPSALFLAIAHENIINQRGPMGITTQFANTGIGTAHTPMALRDTSQNVWFPDFFGSPIIFQSRLTAVAVPAPSAAAAFSVLAVLASSRRRARR